MALSLEGCEFLIEDLVGITMSVNAEFFAVLFDNFPEPLFVIDNQDCCIAHNKAFERWSSYEFDDGIPVSKFWSEITCLPNTASEVRTHFAFPGRSPVDVNVIITWLPNELRLIQILPESGVGGERHFQAQRLRTLGMLAGGVAHDFNNILAGIFGHISFLKNILPETGPHIESLSAIEEGATKASVITKQILNFSKLETSETPKKIDLKELVIKTHSLLRGALPPIIELSYEVPEKPVYVMAVEGRLAQVIVNLVINARDALDKSGKIVVGVNICLDDEKIQAAKLSNLKQWVELRVSDDGKGMPPEVKQRIFEPYFSTKQDKGTGLGLATVLSIVKSFGGGICVNSEIGAGTTMSILLPYVAAVSEYQVEYVSHERMHLSGGKENILVVDDEDAVRSVIKMGLIHLGYNVQVASSGVLAVDLLEHSGQHFDLVILDMLMPHLSGEETYFKLRELDPKIKALAMSGYTSEESVQRILDNGGKGFIQKPFTMEELSKKVRACLDEK